MFDYWSSTNMKQSCIDMNILKKFKSKIRLPYMKGKINLLYIVISVCLFNANTVMASQRPYIPPSSKWPGTSSSLRSLVTKVQNEQRDDNTVVWVDDSSPYFSKAGLGGSNTNSASTPSSVFHGFRDIDIPTEEFSSFDQMSTPIASPVKTKEKSKQQTSSTTSSTVAETEGEITLSQAEQQQAITVLPSSIAIQDFRGIDQQLDQQQLLVEQTGLLPAEFLAEKLSEREVRADVNTPQLGQEALAHIMVWSDLDS